MSRHTSALLVIFLLLVSMGCTSTHPRDVMGRWQFSIGEDKMVLQIADKAQWSWWDVDRVQPSESPPLSGKWFVHERILVLRVEKSESDKVFPGYALTFDLRRVAPERLTVFDWYMGKETTWTRIPDK